MNIPRSALVTALKSLKPLLVLDGPVVAFAHVWMGKDCLRAGSDFLGAWIPLKTGLEGGIRGIEALGLLESSGAADIEVETEGDILKMRMGRANLKLPLLDIKDSLWEFPEPDHNAPHFLLNDIFFHTISRLMISTGGAGNAPEQRGVVIVVRQDAVELASTDAKTVTFIIQENTTKLKPGRYLISSEFLDNLTRLMKTGKLYLMDGLAVAESDSGVRIYGKLIEEPFPVDYNKILDRFMTPEAEESSVVIPSRLEAALKRAGILVKDPKTSFLKFSISKTAAHLAVSSPLGELFESLKFESEHPDVEVKFDPALLSRALPYADTIFFSKDCAVMMADGYWYLAAAIAG